MVAWAERSSTRSFVAVARSRTTSPISLILAAEPKGYVGGSHFVPRSRRQLMDRAIRRRDCTGGDRGRATRRRDRAAPIDLARRPRPATPGRRRPPATQCAAPAARDRRRGRPDRHRQVPRRRWQGSARAQRAGILQRLNQRKWGRVWECDQLLNLVDAFEKSVRVPGP